MNSNPRPVSHAALKRALKESINILKSCADTLHYVDNPKLEKHTMAVTYCYQNCKRALAILENNPEELHAFASFFVMSCEKCVARCKQIDLDIFRKSGHRSGRLHWGVLIFSSGSALEFKLPKCR